MATGDPAETDLLTRIHALVEEEHTLREGAADAARLHELEVQLDQCWDLLRQRRARREFDQDPADTAVRPPETVENYRQ